MSDRFLEIKNLSVNFNGFQAVNDVSISVKKGETRSIIGPNGAGKTTIIDMITGKTVPTSGRIFLNGERIDGKDPSVIASKYRVGRKFQGPNVFNEMTVTENIEVALAGHSRLGQTFLYRRTKKIQDEINDILQQINLYEKRDIITTNLSHGEKQWLEIGMVIAQKPQLITLDEPTAGMTVDETYKTGEMINTLMKDRTVIVIEHDIDFIKQVSQTITVLNMGEIIAEGTYDEITNNPEVVRVYLKREEGE